MNTVAPTHRRLAGIAVAWAIAVTPAAGQAVSGGHPATDLGRCPDGDGPNAGVRGISRAGGGYRGWEEGARVRQGALRGAPAGADRAVVRASVRLHAEGTAFGTRSSIAIAGRQHRRPLPGHRSQAASHRALGPLRPPRDSRRPHVSRRRRQRLRRCGIARDGGAVHGAAIPSGHRVRRLRRRGGRPAWSCRVRRGRDRAQGSRGPERQPRHGGPRRQGRNLHCGDTSLPGAAPVARTGGGARPDSGSGSATTSPVRAKTTGHCSRTTAAFHQAGIPFVYFGVEDHADYHRPSDTADKINPEFFAKAAGVVLDAVRALDAGLR